MLGLGRSGSLLPVLFMGQVMADDAAADRAKDCVVSGVMAGHAADQRPLETAFRLGRTERGERRQGDSQSGGEYCGFHLGFPMFAFPFNSLEADEVPPNGLPGYPAGESASGDGGFRAAIAIRPQRAYKEASP
jgi:hypothetical protein